MTAQEEAKQLDSVTDNVQAKEFDANIAKDAMASLQRQSANQAKQENSIAVSKEDVALIVEQLEVSEEEAEKALREFSAGSNDGKSAVHLALQKLVT
mmetsp:Transcript_11381/g.16713  ORF Transcript_11381/g.16713 Transcript_11381/m.16713 type:complete len:97 (-) Transcript_11381:1716-2006(-)